MKYLLKDSIKSLTESVRKKYFYKYFLFNSNTIMKRMITFDCLVLSIGNTILTLCYLRAYKL